MEKHCGIPILKNVKLHFIRFNETMKKFSEFLIMMF